MNRKMILTTAASLLVGVVAGTGIMMNDQAYTSVKQAVGGSATNNSLANVGNIDLASMDIESALQAVQQQRAQALEDQLKDQVANVQKRNEEIAQLNNILGELSTLRGQSADGNYKVSEGTLSTLSGMGLADASKTDYSANDVDQLIQKIKSYIDNMSNSQQMDMLRLQELNNKRNEAMDVMTDYIKKMEDARNSILGNMR
ncbi:hypothetical protein [Paenibacillus sp. AR247]|uniref:hypothetical protein n=1 Tax=Paenibacillus sp. AR247 TaxID=1631599 RepID=UPI000CFA7671|nr:hypothetical protein [Paenibacillus sp. AR247]PQP88249.1 hypothetical protein CPT76_20565 [Paenibacillus sp. AR247]